jgi:hypothetical protein
MNTSRKEKIMNKPNNNKTAVRIAGSLVLVCMLVMGSTGSLRAQSDQRASARTLEGTWWITVTLYDCVTGTEQPPFVSLLAFAHGGTMSETTGNPAFQPGQRTSGYGTWARASGGTYTSTDEAFILFTAGPFTQGTQRINHSITVSHGGNEFNDEATVQFFDTNGNLLFSGCARVVGTRLD